MMIGTEDMRLGGLEVKFRDGSGTTAINTVTNPTLGQLLVCTLQHVRMHVTS